MQDHAEGNEDGNLQGLRAQVERALQLEFSVNKERRVVPFFGNPDENFEDWAEDAQDLINGITDERSARMVRDAVRGSAKDELRLMERGYGPWASGTVIIEALRKSYGNTLTNSQRRRALALRRQQKTETVAEFSRDLVKLSRNIKDVGPLLVEQFCENIHDEQLRWQLCQLKEVAEEDSDEDDADATFLKLRQYALKYEANRQKRPTNTVAAIEAETIPRPQELQEVQTPVLYRPRAQIQLQESVPPNQVDRSRFQFQGSCHTCGGWGHMARECPSRPIAAPRQPARPPAQNQWNPRPRYNNLNYNQDARPQVQWNPWNNGGYNNSNYAMSGPPICPPAFWAAPPRPDFHFRPTQLYRPPLPMPPVQSQEMYWRQPPPAPYPVQSNSGNDRALPPQQQHRPTQDGRAFLTQAQTTNP